MLIRTEAFRRSAAVSPTAGTLKAVGVEPLNGSNLVFAFSSHPAGSTSLGKDLVSGVTGTLFGSGTMGGTWPAPGNWKCLQATTSHGGIYWPSRSTGFDSIASTWTMIAHLNLRTAGASAGGAHIISIPWFNDNWANPWSSFEWKRASPFDRQQIVWQRGGAHDTSFQNPSSTVWSTTGSKMWAVTKTGATGQYYAAGATDQGTVTVATNDIDWGDEDGGHNIGPTLLNRNVGSQGEQCDAELFWLLIWNTALSAGDIAAYNTDPMKSFVAT